MLLGTLGASLLGNLLTGKGALATISSRWRHNWSRPGFLMLPHPLTNFEIQNEPKFNGVSSGNNIPKIKDWAYVINLDEFNSIGTH